MKWSSIYKFQYLWWHIKYELWPPVKVKTKYYWWIVRYGGKKRIPKEVVFRAMAKSLKRMNDNLDKAYQIGGHSSDVSAEEVHQILDAQNQARKLTENVEKLK